MWLALSKERQKTTRLNISKCEYINAGDKNESNTMQPVFYTMAENNHDNVQLWSVVARSESEGIQWILS